MRRGYAHSSSFERALTLTFVAAIGAALVASCGSISVVSDGGSGAGGRIDVTTGSGGTTGTGGSGTGGQQVTGSGGAVGTGGATGTGGMTPGTGGAAGTGGATGTGGMTPGTGGATGTPDAGVDRGCICPTVIAPVCGSDGMTYNNTCLAGCAGVTVSHTGACVVACTAVRGCCSTDSDCNANEECAGTLCTANGRANGVCKVRPARNSGRCWTDADCAQNPNNNNCTGAVVCACNANCVRADMLGTCN